MLIEALVRQEIGTEEYFIQQHVFSEQCSPVHVEVANAVFGHPTPIHYWEDKYMGTNNGHDNEYEIIDFLNGKAIEELPAHFKNWLNKLFGCDKGNLEVTKLNNEQKADIIIKVGTQKKYISIKSGGSNSFHSEDIATFIPFMRKLGISERTLKIIVLFHFGDNTLNGSGPHRFTSAELRRAYSHHFQAASDEISQDHIMRPIIERCILQGRYPANYRIDGIYHGTTEGGFFISSGQIERILLRKTYIRKNGTINFKMLTYQPGSRNLWGIAGSEQKRRQSEIKWRSFTKDAETAIRFNSEINRMRG